MPDEPSFYIDLVTKEAHPMSGVTLSDVGLKERADLQRWVEDHPEIVESDVLLITTEFDRWEHAAKPIADRLDVLFLDSTGSLLLAELKRDEAPDTIEMQALKYAAFCSQLTVDDIVEEYARHHKVSEDEARTSILRHAPALAESELGQTRIRLVAAGFGPAVTTLVLWLRDIGLDIGCNEISAQTHLDGYAELTSRRLLPPPAAEEYLVRRRRREREEEARSETRRRRTSMAILVEADAVPPGTPLILDMTAFTRHQREAVEPVVQSDPNVARAEWVGIDQAKALRWSRDGEVYSCSGVVEKLLHELGIVASIPGPDFWLLPNGRNLNEEAAHVLAGNQPETE